MDTSNIKYFEIINPNIIRGQINQALFDFDGTISLIREGWQRIMIPMMVEILMETPCHELESRTDRVGYRICSPLDRKTNHLSNDPSYGRDPNCGVAIRLQRWNISGFISSG